MAEEYTTASVPQPDDAPTPQYLGVALAYLQKWKHGSYKGREEVVKERERMAVHISGVMPEHLIATRRPREEKEIFEFRKKNYEPTTQPIITAAIDGLNRIFNRQNYVIKTSDDLRAYLDEAEFNGYAFMDWFQFVFKSFMLEDANGMVVCIPSGEGLWAENKIVEPYLETVPCTHIIACDMETNGIRWLLLLKEERKSEYCVVRYFDEEYYYEIKYYYAKNKGYEILAYYAHNLGYVPAKFAKGRWNTEKGIYQSFFSSFVPEANQSIREESDHMGTMITCGHPYRIVDPVLCTAEGCEGGWLQGIRDFEHRCGTCNGTGTVIDSSPFGIFTRGTDNNGEPSSKEPIEFVSPDTAILKFQAESIESRRMRAKYSLHLDTIDDAQSGTAKAIDREREYAMILMISNNIFDHIEFALITFERYININNPQMPTVVRPCVFGLKTVADLNSELAELQKANAPAPLIAEIIKEIIQKRFPGDDQMAQRHSFLMQYDPYYIYLIGDKQMLLASQIITQLEFQRSVQASSELDKLVRAKQLVITPDIYDAIATELDSAINARILALTPATVAPIAIQTIVDKAIVE